MKISFNYKIKKLRRKIKKFNKLNRKILIYKVK